jgi:hypothetical protein
MPFALQIKKHQKSIQQNHTNNKQPLTILAAVIFEQKDTAFFIHQNKYDNQAIIP